MVPQHSTTLPLVVSITGASGAVYSLRLLEVLLTAGRQVHLSISPSGAAVLLQELQKKISLERFDPHSLLSPAIADQAANQIHYHHYQDFFAPIASGSFLTAGMVVCPCSGSTLSGIAHGTSSNLIQRAADVHLKE